MDKQYRNDLLKKLAESSASDKDTRIVMEFADDLAKFPDSKDFARHELQKEKWANEFVDWAVKNTCWNEPTAREIASENYDLFEAGHSGREAASQLKLECGA